MSDGMTMPPPLDGHRLPPATGGDPAALAVLLHGYGSNGADLIGLAPYLAEALPDLLCVAPNAPLPLGGLANAYQWWPLASFEPAALAVGAASAADALDAYIDAELARAKLPPERLVLIGFSQGTMMALHVGLRRRTAPAAIIGYSGALADVGTLAKEIAARPPVLLVHGEADDIVPVIATDRAERTLRALDVPVTTILTPGLAHSIDAAGIAAGARFVREALAAR